MKCRLRHSTNAKKMNVRFHKTKLWPLESYEICACDRNKNEEKPSTWRRVTAKTASERAPTAESRGRHSKNQKSSFHSTNGDGRKFHGCAIKVAFQPYSYRKDGPSSSRDIRDRANAPCTAQIGMFVSNHD